MILQSRSYLTHAATGVHGKRKYFQVQKGAGEIYEQQRIYSFNNLLFWSSLLFAFMKTWADTYGEVLRFLLKKNEIKIFEKVLSSKTLKTLAMRKSCSVTHYRLRKVSSCLTFSWESHWQKCLEVIL